MNIRELLYKLFKVTYEKRIRAITDELRDIAVDLVIIADEAEQKEEELRNRVVEFNEAKNTALKLSQNINKVFEV